MRSVSANGHGRDGDAAAAAINRYAGDERLAGIFKQMRAIAGVSLSEMARQLGTNVATLLDFEAGAVATLPDWPETVRIVERYGQLTGVDPSSILSRLLQLQPLPLDATGPQPILPGRLRPQEPDADVRRLPAAPSRAPLPPAPARPALLVRQSPVMLAPQVQHPPHNPPAPFPGPPAGAPPSRAPQPQESADGDHAVGFDSRSRARETTVRTARQSQPGTTAGAEAAAAARRKRRRRRSLLAAAPLAVCLGVFAGMLAAPRPFYKIAHTLPGPVALPIFAMLDTAVVQAAAVREGLRWIELDEPRLRKGDRQQPTTPVR